jgi:ABC-type glutathione transport system ATPase component
MAGSPASVAPKIQIEGVSKWFGSTIHPMLALLDISLEVHTNEFVCLLGPSGSGKSSSRSNHSRRASDKPLRFV